MEFCLCYNFYMNKDLYYGLILDKFLDENNLNSEQLKMLDEAKSYFMEKSKENMGIGMMNACYIFTRDDQDIWEEYSKIENFVKDYTFKHASSKNKNVQDFELEFINYGRTEIVYVLKDKLTNEKITILAKQPVVEYGKVFTEVNNLITLNSKDKNVVAPIDYFTNNEQELYVTPYIEQARCVASDGKWGIYIPEPFYRFENFTSEQEKIVNTCMIAKIVSLYDFKNMQGVASLKLGGGDFMLPKGWETEKPTINNTLNNLYFIAAREMINCSFDKYLEILKDEFSRKTIDENQENLVLNHRGRVPMKIEDIENGIKLGKEIINNRNKTSEKNNESQEMVF